MKSKASTKQYEPGSLQPVLNTMNREVYSQYQAQWTRKSTASTKHNEQTVKSTASTKHNEQTVKSTASTKHHEPGSLQSVLNTMNQEVYSQQ